MPRIVVSSDDTQPGHDAEADIGSLFTTPSGGMQPAYADALLNGGMPIGEANSGDIDELVGVLMLSASTETPAARHKWGLIFNSLVDATAVSIGPNHGDTDTSFAQWIHGESPIWPDVRDPAGAPHGQPWSVSAGATTSMDGDNYMTHGAAASEQSPYPL